MSALSLTLAESIPRSRLGDTCSSAAAAESPADLPGRPTPIGSGSVRAHVRWTPADLAVWWQAYGAWRRGETHRPARRPRLVHHGQR